MSSLAYLQFVLATLLPVAAAAAFHLLERNTSFGGWRYGLRQMAYGAVFGAIAIFGTEFGIYTEDATMNVRDAAPIAAGLLFGGPAGIMAGLLGGVERWFAALWGRGMFTRVGCTLGTILAGFYAAFLRRYMLEQRKPSWLFALAIGVVAEVLHLTLIFVTNLDDVQQAYEVVRACTFPMVVANGVSVALATVAVTLLSHEKLSSDREQREISTSVQNGMLIVTLMAFLVTCGFTFALQNNLAVSQVNELLSLNLEGVCEDVREALAVTGERAGQDAVVRGLTREWHVGETGSVIIADERDEVLSYQEGGSHTLQDHASLLSGLGGLRQDTVLEVTYGDEAVYVMQEVVEGYRVVAILPKRESIFARNVAVLVMGFMEILAFAILYVFIYFLIRHLVVDNIWKVNATLAAITDGNLDATVDVRSNQEFALLSDGINSTVTALTNAIDEAARRIDTELEYARTIQRSALPRFFPPYPNRDDFTIFASMDAAREVGGDFYDFYLLDEDRLAFLVADVSGKGIPAAMFMMTAKTLLKSLTEAGVPVEDVFMHGNDELCLNNEAEMFVTVWMGILDLATGHVTYANAGHNPPVVMRGDGSCSFERVRPNLVLAGIEGIPYRAHELDLAPGDALFLYTDGVTEATDDKDELFGEDRLLETLQSHVAEDVEMICRAVHRDVDDFVGGAAQFDDITMLALRYQGRE